MQKGIEEYEKSFDDYIKSKGGIGRLDTDELEPEIGSFFNGFKSNMQAFVDERRFSTTTAKRMPHIHVDLIDNLSFNAQAIVDKNGLEFIGINHGAVLILLDVFNRILARNDTFLTIGDPDVEENPERLPFLPNSYADIQEFYGTDDLESQVLPIDPARQDHAAILTEMALLYLVDHEIAHLRYGHVHYKKQEGGLSYIAEIEPSSKSGFSPLTVKTLEWSADTWAAQQSIYRLLTKSEDSDNYITIKQGYETPEVGIYINWSYAMWVTYRLMEEVKKRLEEKYSPLSYKPHERLYVAFHNACLMLDVHGQQYKSELFINNVPKFMRQAEDDLCKISQQEISRDELSQFFNNIVTNPEDIFVMQLREHWDKIVRPDLLSLSRADDITLF